jgi:alpha-amylase/alpha-mannosidase (GH57 family)
MTEPLHVAFVWHMHQPYYRSAGSGAFELPWVRLHALKDYLDMVETLGPYPEIHQTFNLVPSLVEQLEYYAAGDFVDVYWAHTLKPAAELDPADQTFIVERMCEHPDHPRAHLHPRYLELARKREAQASLGWEACAQAFTVAELRDLQVWFNLAWFDPEVTEKGVLAGLVERGRDFREEDKRLLAEVQAEILTRTLPAYRSAAERGQIEISTSPYFHPILPLLANSDSARISAADQLLPPRRFAHGEDAAEQIRTAVAKHTQVFGAPPRGLWCSEQAVGEDVIPLLVRSGLQWTISDETVLARSLSGAAVSESAACRPAASDAQAGPWITGPGPRALEHERYRAYRLEREEGEVAIVFRDHTLSDLIGFAYQSWAARDAATNLLQRLSEIQTTVSLASRDPADIPLVTIALDGENAWEYYPRDGRDFLQYLYEGLRADPAFRCLTVSEHLREVPPRRSLGWLHTGSWIGGDLRTWSGDRAHNRAWDLLHHARDLAASKRVAVVAASAPRVSEPQTPAPPGSAQPELPARVAEPLGRTSLLSHPGQETVADGGDLAESAWRHVMIAEGSDWFWWFGDHHHSDLDHVWDRDFRRHLQEIYRILGESVPERLFLPILEQAPSALPSRPQAELNPLIDGLVGGGPAGEGSEWDAAGFLAPDLPSTMQRSEATRIRAVRFGWSRDRLCLLIVPGSSTLLPGLEIEVRVTRVEKGDDPVLSLTLAEEGRAAVSCSQCSGQPVQAEVAWRNVVEVAFFVDTSEGAVSDLSGLVLRIGRNGLTEHVFHSAGLASLGWRAG